MNNLVILMGGGAAGGNPITQIVPLVLIVVVFYFFMIRPQMKRQKETRIFRDSLAKGDKVVTTGGIYGKIVEVKETVIILEIAKDVHITVDKNGIVKDMSNVQPQR